MHTYRLTVGPDGRVTIPGTVPGETVTVQVVKTPERLSLPTARYDPNANAAYIQVADADVSETVQLGDGVYLDIDADGKPVGVEVLNADSTALADLMKTNAV